MGYDEMGYEKRCLWTGPMQRKNLGLFGLFRHLKFFSAYFYAGCPWTDMVKENHELFKQNQALAITIQEMKRRKDSISYWYKELESLR